MKISIIIPVYYNEENLEDLYADIKAKVLDKIGEYEIVFVDDGSGDDSWNIMNRIREKDDNIRCVKLSRNFGEHCALQAGLSVCTGDCAVTKQADLQEDSTLILEMYERYKQGNEVVLAARNERNDNLATVFFAPIRFAAKQLNIFISSELVTAIKRSALPASASVSFSYDVPLPTMPITSYKFVTSLIFSGFSSMARTS